MASYRIVVDHDRCIRCLTCTRTCPEHWVKTRDGSPRLRSSRRLGGSEIKRVTAPGSGLEAAHSCPIGCISIYGQGWQALG